MKRLVVFT